MDEGTVDDGWLKASKKCLLLMKRMESEKTLINSE